MASDAPIHIFVSYSHRNEDDKDRLVTHLKLMERQGLVAPWDDRQIAPAEEWEPAIKEHLERAGLIILLISADFLASDYCWGKELKRAMGRHDAGEAKVVPVFAQPCDWKGAAFGKLQGVPQDAVPISDFPNPEFGFAEAAKAIRQAVENLRSNPQSPVRDPQSSIALSRLPHGAEKLFGRDEELKRLDDAWADTGTHVVSIVAWGGVGKTALAVEWMVRLAQRDWAGVERYFDWSFYSQGTRGQGAASADIFIAAALAHFGDPDPQAGSAWDRGERLARLVAQRPTVLILDGVEPLQHPPGPLAGQFKDPALQSLLRGLAQRPLPGLCVVTTRESIEDLAPFHDKTVDKWNLEHLSDEAGAELLRQTCGCSTEAELRKASQEVKGHALTLLLMGGYVGLVHAGDIRCRDRFGFQEADTQVQGGHAFRVIRAYEQWLPQSGETGERGVAILRLLGLFDRPANAGCLAALRREPTIPGLTESLFQPGTSVTKWFRRPEPLSDDEWIATLKRLESVGLVTLASDQSPIVSPKSAIVDCHPLIRDYFAKQLQGGRPNAWRLGHRRLYEHLIETSERRPDTLEGLQPLYQAVAHGCQAGLQEQVCNRVYVERILRGTDTDGFYTTRKLGAVGADLGAVACFFDQPWCRLSWRLSGKDQAWLLNEAASRLRALGRLAEAVEPMLAGMELEASGKNWKNAAIVASNLSELGLTLGNVDEATTSGMKAVAFADRAEDVFQRAHRQARLADAIHQAGGRDEAQQIFEEAEALQTQSESGSLWLNSLSGFQYCALLLSQAERAVWQAVVHGHVCAEGLPHPAGRTTPYTEVIARARRSLDRAGDEADVSLLNIALDRLTLGRATLYQSILSAPNSGAEEFPIGRAADHIGAAVNGLRQAGTMHHVPRGLLTRALLRHMQGDAEGAERDLDEAWEIAERGPMRLHMADVQLTRARLFRDRATLAEARELIEQCGYHRRDEELADAERAAAEGWRGGNGFLPLTGVW